MTVAFNSGNAAIRNGVHRRFNHVTIRRFLRRLLAAILLCQPLLTAAVEVKQMAPNFDLLSRQRGKVVLLDFWASWCGPCRQALPRYEELRRSYGTKGFEVVAVGVDQQPHDGEALLKTMHLSFPQVQDPQGKIAQAYAVPGMPTAYLIDRHGVVQQIHTGFGQNDFEPLRQAVEQLLGEQ